MCFFCCGDSTAMGNVYFSKIPLLPFLLLRHPSSHQKAPHSNPHPTFTCCLSYNFILPEHHCKKSTCLLLMSTKPKLLQYKVALNKTFNRHFQESTHKEHLPGWVVDFRVKTIANESLKCYSSIFLRDPTTSSTLSPEALCSFEDGWGRFGLTEMSRDPSSLSSDELAPLVRDEVEAARPLLLRVM